MKSIFKQKTIQRIAGIIAFAAVIVFSFVACGLGEEEVPKAPPEEPILTMQFTQIDDYNKPGNEEWDRWENFYQNDSKSYDLSSMYANKKVYIFNYSFTSDQDIDRLSVRFIHKKPDGSEWEDDLVKYTVLNVSGDIKKNTRFSGRVALIPKSGCAGKNKDNIYLNILIHNRNVNTTATLSFYQFSFDIVNKEEGLTKWTIGDKEFDIETKTYAKTETNFQGKTNVLHIRPSYNVGQYADQVMYYDLSSYAGKTIELVMSVDVYLTKPARIAWQIDSSNPFYPVVAGTVEPDDRIPNHGGPKLSANKWHTISGSNVITVPNSGDNGKKLYLSGMQIDGAEVYFANPRSSTTQGSGGNTNVTLNSITVEGTPTNKLILNFSGLINGLTADNIILSGDVTGVIKGALSNSGSTYTLLISGFTAGGKLKVWVSKLGYNITGASKEVTIIGTGGGGGGGGQNDPGDLAGTWTGKIGSYDAIITVSGSGWTMTASGTSFYDSGYFIRNGNTATLYLSSGTNNGTATLINSTTIQVVLNSNTIFPGTYTLTKQGGSGGGNTTVTNGILKVTDIPSQYNGKWVYVMTDDEAIWGAETISMAGTGTGVLISNGSVSIPMWNARSGSFVKYSGNNSLQVFVGVASQKNGSVDSWSSSDIDYITIAYAFYSSPITFQNGGATVSWNSANQKAP
jgi:hypothetical protein